MQLLKPQILKAFIDAVRGGSMTSVLLNIALLFIGVSLIEQLIQASSVFFSETVGWKATNDLRYDLAKHSLHLDFQFHNLHTPGELIERIDGDVTALANFFSQFALRVLGNTLFIIGMLLLLFREHWLVGAGMSILTLVFLFAINALRIRSLPYWIAGRQTSADLAGFFEERLAGVEDIRTSGANAYKMNMLYAIMRSMYEAYRSARIIANLISNSAFLMHTLALVMGIGLGAYLFYRNEMSLGSIFLISYYARMLSWPLREVVNQLEDLQKADASIERIQELRSAKSLVVDGPGAPMGSGPVELSFEDVSFEYFPGSPVLTGVAFHLEAGKVLGLLGRTGSGKTTLTRLLFRFYDPSGGTIRLDGADLRQPRLAQLRRRIGLVTQEVQLFRGTIRDNLTLFDHSISDQAITAAIEGLELGAWLDRMPHGLDTLLAAGGGGLSAGEAQLLAFGRVFLKNPGLVILDEASSRLDPATERLVERAVDRLLRNRTGIIIAHRLGTVQRVDNVMILEKGQVLEYGDRRELVSRPDSHFAQLLVAGMEEALI